MARPGFCQPAVIEKIKVLLAAVIGNPETSAAYNRRQSQAQHREQCSGFGLWPLRANLSL
jgi:hypothetical protein